MKRFFLVAICVLFAGAVSAQNNNFNEGDRVINAGIGLGNNVYGSGYTSKFIPISISAEWGVMDNLFDEKSTLGIGGYFAYTGAKYALGDSSYGYKYNSYIFGLRGILHYNFAPKWDTYAGLMLGYNLATASRYGDWGSINTAAASASGISYSFFVGARYQFNEKFGAFAELGYGIASLNVGISIKM